MIVLYNFDGFLFQIKRKTAS